MNIVFLNSLERTSKDNRVVTAQISICEQQGEWHLFWSEAKSDGKMEQSEWYVGSSWKALLTTFRHGVAVKLGEGFYPLIDGMLEGTSEKEGKMYRTQMLSCYSDLHPNDALYAVLNTWRRSRAGLDRKAPYFIATNRMLRLVSTFIPQTIDELMQIPGFGESKVKLYGEAIIELTQAVEQQTAFPLDWVENELSREQYTQWLYKQKELKYKQEMDRLTEQRQILEGIQKGYRMSEISEQCQLTRRELLLSLESLERSGYDTMRIVEEELQEVPMEEQTAIWEVFERDGDKYLKPVLLEVYGEEAQQTSKLPALYERLRLMRLRFRHQKDHVEQQAG